MTDQTSDNSDDIGERAAGENKQLATLAMFRATPTTEPPAPSAYPTPPVIDAPKTKIPKVDFDRTSRAQAAWDTVREQIREVLALTTSGDVTGDLVPFVRRVEYGFNFRAQPEDTDLSSLHIEPLLDQAADQLDRGIRERAAWDELSAKWMTLALEIGEYADLDVIHKEEEKAGYYDHPAQLSAAELNAEVTTASLNGYAKTIASNAASNLFTGAKANELHNANIKSAWLGGLVHYTFQGQAFAGYTSHTYGNVTKTPGDHYYDASIIQSNHSISSQYANWRTNAESFGAVESASNARVVGLRSRSTWLAADSGFGRRRTVVARKFQDIKAKAATDLDGALNYGKRLASLKLRFQADFRDAIARMTVVADGLRSIYNYTDPLPSNTTSIDYFDDCLLWVRRAIQWLIRFSRQDQNAIVPVSVKDLLDKKWDTLLKDGKHALPLSGAIFDGMCNVRLRGLGAAVDEGGSAKRLWNIEVSPPKLGDVTHHGGSTSTIDQKNVPSCRLARVTGRDDKREPDVVGVSSLHNASPIGAWEIVIRGATPSVSGGFSGKLNDIVLDLHVAFRASK